MTKELIDLYIYTRKEEDLSKFHSAYIFHKEAALAAETKEDFFLHLECIVLCYESFLKDVKEVGLQYGIDLKKLKKEIRNGNTDLAILQPKLKKFTRRFYEKKSSNSL